MGVGKKPLFSSSFTVLFVFIYLLSAIPGQRTSGDLFSEGSRGDGVRGFNVQDFFKEAESQGVKLSTIDRGIKQLRAVITLYRETTEMLISDFIGDETRSGLESTDTSCGELHLEIDAYSHHSTGELDGNIRVISAVELKTLSGIAHLKPFIELNMLAPTLSSNQRKFSTNAKSSASPNFNQTFKFTLASTWENSELLVVAKHKATFGKDRVIGLAVVPFASIKEQASLTLGLAPSIPVSDRGQAILNVLTVRGDDNYAKEFVMLKSHLQYNVEC